MLLLVGGCIAAISQTRPRGYASAELGWCGREAATVGMLPCRSLPAQCLCRCCAVAVAKPHTVPSGTGDQLPVTSSGLGLGTQSPAIGWGLTGDWGLSLQPEGWDWGLSHQLMLGTAAGLGTGVPA